MRVGIAGISGRMGRLLAEEVAKSGAVLVGGIRGGGTAEPPDGITVFVDALGLATASDVMIDFTHANSVAAHAAAVMHTRVAWVLGSSGLSAAQEATVAGVAVACPVVYSANFSTGVNLVLALAERMAAILPADRYDAEILEMHHRQKIDAPSGTAIALGRAVARGRGIELAEWMESGRDGHTGARRTGSIGFAALRGGQVIGEHSLIFAAGDEQVVLTHRSFDRRAYATGAVHAASWVVGRPPGLYSMQDVLAG